MEKTLIANCSTKTWAEQFKNAGPAPVFHRIMVVGGFICWTYVAWLALFGLVGWLDGLLRVVWFGLGCLRCVVSVK